MTDMSHSLKELGDRVKQLDIKLHEMQTNQENRDIGFKLATRKIVIAVCRHMDMLCKDMLTMYVPSTHRIW
jgi:hypothetical protein